MDFFSQYGLFAAKIFTVVIAILLLAVGLVVIASSKGDKDSDSKLSIKKINQKFANMQQKIKRATSDKKAFKAFLKQSKQKDKTEKSDQRIFLLEFKGDIKASQVSELGECISAILTDAGQNDEVLLKLESPGGAVNGYGLAASQLARLREHNIPLTVAVDKVAASGGYMMAAVADKIIAAPFALIGSIGVVAQLPNFNRWLKKNNIDFESITAGEYKRTLSLFGENTKQGREKFQQQLEEIHELFKQHIAEYRPSVDLASVATGEYWLARRALELNLVDALMTSDDYLLDRYQQHDIYQVSYRGKKSWQEKLTDKASALLQESVQFR